MQSIVMAVLVTFFLCLFLGGLSVGGYFLYRSRKKQIEVQERFCESVERLSKVTEALADIPKLIAGHGAAAGAIAVEVAKFRDSVDRFSGLIKRPDERESSVDYTKVEDANKVWEVTQILAENPEIGLDRARELAEERLSQEGALPHLGME